MTVTYTCNRQSVKFEETDGEKKVIVLGVEVEDDRKGSYG